MDGRNSRFRTWLKDIPIEDPINRQMAALLQVILLGLVTIILISTIANLFLLPPENSRYELIIQSILILLIFTAPVILLRRGFFRISVIIIIAIFIVLVSATIINRNLRATAESLAFFTIGILLAGLLLDRRALIFTFTISAVIVLFFALQEQDPTVRLDYIAVAGNFILINGLMSVFINFFGTTLRNNLRSSLQREEEIKILNEQLQKQVAELERFTYTVSHDLRSPLVTIKGFLGMLEQDLQDQRLDKVQNDSQRIAGATDKMNELLSDLLELSRIGRIINPPEEVNLSRIIQDAIDSVEARLRSKHVTVNIKSDLPSIYGDRIRLREVFENLIDNAVKYMGNQSNPVIDIGTIDDEDGQIIFVKDNGMGIETEYQSKIFGLFEKLDPTIEGTGIGLALVKRIIETHGGKIWVKSDGLGKGSTFCFTIPDNMKSLK